MQQNLPPLEWPFNDVVDTLAGSYSEFWPDYQERMKHIKKDALINAEIASGPAAKRRLDEWHAKHEKGMLCNAGTLTHTVGYSNHAN